MSVLVFAESNDGSCGKAAFAAVSYGKNVADVLKTENIALTIGSPANRDDLGEYGAGKIFNVPIEGPLDGRALTHIISEVANVNTVNTIILSHTSTGRAIAGRLAVKMDAGLVSSVNSLPDVSDGFRVKRSVFSGKAVAEYEISSETRVLTLAANAFQAKQSGKPIPAEDMEIMTNPPIYRIEELIKSEGEIPLPEADLVVSGGRGFKGPENWNILIELARALGAATACSRPVADSGWRPHNEHVGQTGLTVRPNLYVAIGISGAIQHLGGVNNSRAIVVINKDPEAPFFKAANYGIVGDLFEVVPRLTEAVLKFKGG
jgi:electron transfer flavoprotein alpha subunit